MSTRSWVLAPQACGQNMLQRAPSHTWANMTKRGHSNPHFIVQLRSGALCMPATWGVWGRGDRRWAKSFYEPSSTGEEGCGPGQDRFGCWPCSGLYEPNNTHVTNVSSPLLADVGCELIEPRETGMWRCLEILHFRRFGTWFSAILLCINRSVIFLFEGDFRGHEEECPSEWPSPLAAASISELLCQPGINSESTPLWDLPLRGRH